MMRFLLLVAITAIVSYCALLIMPWWIPMAVSFFLVLILPTKRNWQAFLATGLGASLCYTLIALVTDYANEHILSQKMAILFGVRYHVLMIVITALTGFLTAGLGGWTASALRRLLGSKAPGKNELAGEQSSS